MFSMEERIQTVLFMRHAVALHNVAAAATSHSSAQLLSTDPAWVDPELTPYGKLQAVVAGGILLRNTHWSMLLLQQEPAAAESSSLLTSSSCATGAVGSGRRRSGRFGLELVVTSPLTRCLQTATLAFLPPFMPYDDDANDHGSVPSPPPPAIVMICREEVREAFGIQYPDRRRSKSVLQVRVCVCLRARIDCANA
jgi:hypothetical protein